MRWNYKFKGKRISQWLKLAIMNYKNNSYLRYLPLKVLVHELIPKYPSFKEFIEESLVEYFINESWDDRDKQTLIYFLKEFIKRNFNKEV
jgi:hypothetical protein